MESATIPVILVTGFLGAGKTTLINNLIDYFRNQKIGLIINEFGEINIDGQLITSTGKEIIELNRGSLFCVCIRDNLVKAIKSLVQRNQPELILIETTGLADVTEMNTVFTLPIIKSLVQIQVVICLIDCISFTKILTILSAPISQVRQAQLILLNKIDQVTTGQSKNIQTIVKSINQTALTITTTYGQFNMNILTDIISNQIDQVDCMSTGQTDPVNSIALSSFGYCTNNAWRNYVDLLQQQDLLRIKGFINREDGWHYIDYVFGSSLIEKSVVAGHAVNQLQVIGRCMDQDAIKNKFNALFDSTQI